MPDTGLPGNANTNALPICPNRNGMPGLMRTFQKYTFPISATMFGRKSASPAETPPLLTMMSALLAGAFQRGDQRWRIVAQAFVRDEFRAVLFDQSADAVAVAVVDLAVAALPARRDQFIAGREENRATAARDTLACVSPNEASTAMRDGLSTSPRESAASPLA